MLQSTTKLMTNLNDHQKENPVVSQCKKRSNHTHRQSPTTNLICNGQRKISLSYQQQLQRVTVGGDSFGSCGIYIEEINTKCVSPQSFNQQPNDSFMHHHHDTAKLFMQSNYCNDDTLTFNIPPPSPAPTSDRFLMVASTLTTTSSTNITHNHYSNSKNKPVESSTMQSNQSIVSPSSFSTVATTSSKNESSISGSQQHIMLKAGMDSAGLILSKKYSSTNSVLSLNRSRFRVSDRFREKPSVSSSSTSSSRYASLSPSPHFLNQNNTFVPSDAFSYFSSAVHTPVKRYVPTPPPQSQLFVDMPLSLQQQQQNSMAQVEASTKLNTMHQQLQNKQLNQQHQTNTSTFPYRLRMKCCSAEVSQQQQISGYLQLSTMPSRTVLPNSKDVVTNLTNSPNGKVSPIEAQHNLQLPCHQMMSYSSSTAFSSSISSPPLPPSSGASPIRVEKIASAGNRQLTTSRSSNNCLENEFLSRTQSIEYIQNSTVTSNSGSVGHVLITVNALSGNDTNSNGSVSTNACLHCKTARRTTGVHQTTQTTGPISPVPLQQLNGNNICSLRNNLEQKTFASRTSNYESHTSPLSPTIVLKQEKIPLQHKSHLENVEAEQHEQLIYQQHCHQQHLHQLVKTQNNFINHNIMRTEQQPHAETHRQQSSLQMQMIRQSLPLQQQLEQYSRKQRISKYICREIATFFGVDARSEFKERAKWYGRQRRLAIRRFGILRSENDLRYGNNEFDINSGYIQESLSCSHHRNVMHANEALTHQHTSERPDILPVQDAENKEMQITIRNRSNSRRRQFINTDFKIDVQVERKASVLSMLMSGLTCFIQVLHKRQLRNRCQWSRSFAPSHVTYLNENDVCDGLTFLQEEEIFFDSPSNDQRSTTAVASNASTMCFSTPSNIPNSTTTNAKIIEQQKQLYMGERAQGWRTSSIVDNIHSTSVHAPTLQQQLALTSIFQSNEKKQIMQHQQCIRGNRISSQILDGILENSRRPLSKRAKLFSINDLDDRLDHRPFFTYWINTVQILVLCLSLICYGIGPIGFGVEQKNGQVLVTSLSLQTVQHQELRNVWIGPRNTDLVHMGAKFAACMRRDIKIMEVLIKTRRQERETACCIRNDDSGCVQSSQAECSVRGLFPTKSISTWKKWSPGESGPGGRISGTVCGLDPKYCDAPASIAPYEWPDDITKWPICRKTNAFPQRFRYKDHTAEHMVCEVIGHPCCTGVFGECRITTKEYCDFVNGYFHEEASLCSQISCLSNVCGMFPFFSIGVPDQFYRLFTSLCLHAGIVHLAITVVFQHVLLADLERLMGPIRTAIVYIGSGLAGNITSIVLLPYKPEVGPLASLSGVVASLVVLLILMHWKQLQNPQVALFKLIFIGGVLFGIGTLPWQLNFAGLLAGILSGIFLTTALVPFVSVTKYRRKSKMNLIWTCILFHLLVYTITLIMFYIFPQELTSLNFEEFLNGGGWNLHPSDIKKGNIEVGSNELKLSSNQDSQQMQQSHRHRLSDDIIGNSPLESSLSKSASLGIV